MNREQLRQHLEAERIRPNAYCLKGGLPSEAHTIDFHNGNWEVYYSERGERSGLMTFESEAAACAHLLELILADQSTRVFVT